MLADSRQVSILVRTGQLESLAAELAHCAAQIEHNDARDAVQSDALRGIAEGLQSGELRGYVEIPSRVGKSRLIAYLANAAYDNNIRCLILAPTQEGLLQIRAELVKYIAPEAIGMIFEDVKQFDRRVTLCTYRSFVEKEKTSQLVLSDYQLVIPDESHEALTDLRSTPLQRYDGVIIPVSATPSYSAGKSVHRLAPTEFYSLSLVDAARRGTLSDFRTFLVDTEISLRDLPFNKFGYKVGALSSTLQKVVVMKVGLDAYNEICPGERAIGFCATNEHAADCASYFRENGVAADVISGNDDNRREKLEALAQGRINVLFSSDLLTRSVDIPQVCVVLNLTPTQSIVRAKQRGARCLTKNPHDPQKIGKVIELLYTDSRWEVRQVLFPQVAGVISSMQGEVVEFAMKESHARRLSEPHAPHKHVGKHAKVIFDPNTIRQIAHARELKYREHKDRIALPDLLRFIRALRETVNTWVTSGVDYKMIASAHPISLDQAAVTAGLRYTPLPAQFEAFSKRTNLEALLRLHYEVPLDLESAAAALKQVSTASSDRSAGRPLSKDTEFFRLLQKLAKQSETAIAAYRAFALALAPHLELFFSDNPSLTPVEKEIARENVRDVFYNFFLNPSLLFVSRIALFEAIFAVLPNHVPPVSLQEFDHSRQISVEEITRREQIESRENLDAAVEWLDKLAKQTGLNDLSSTLELIAEGKTRHYIARQLDKPVTTVSAEWDFVRLSFEPDAHNSSLLPELDAIRSICREVAQEVAEGCSLSPGELETIAKDCKVGLSVIQRIYRLELVEQRKLAQLKSRAAVSDAKEFFGSKGVVLYNALLSKLPADTIIKILTYKDLSKLPSAEDLDLLTQALNHVSSEYGALFQRVCDLANQTELKRAAFLKEIFQHVPELKYYYPGLRVGRQLSPLGRLFIGGIYDFFRAGYSHVTY